MNKFLKLGVMALACTFVFSGCRIKYETGSGETDGTVGESAVESSDKAGGEILHVRYANESYTPYLEICKTEFEKNNQGVSVVLDCVSLENYIVNINNDSTTENVPDVYLVSNSDLSTAYLAGLASKVTNEEFVNRVYDKVAFDACSYNGSLVAYPLSYRTTFLVYNSLYVENDEDFTFEKIKKYSEEKELTNDQMAVVEKIFNCNLTDLFMNYGYIGGYINIGGVYGSDSGEFTVCNDNSVSATGKYLELVDYFSIDKAQEYGNVVKKTVGGNSIFSIVSTDSFQEIKASGLEFRYKEFPDFDDSLVTSPLSITTAIAVNPYSKVSSLGEAFAKFAAETMSDKLNEAAGMFPANKNAVINKEYSGIYSSYMKSTSKNKLQYGEQVYPLIEIALHNILNGEDIKTELQSVDAYMKKQLK